MGKLTDDLTRLRGEIEILRGSREVLMQDLARGANHLTDTVATMISNFAADHIMRATKAEEERKTFVFSMSREVDTMLEDFCKTRENWARMDRENRGRFLLDMRTQVNDLRKITADDLTGARLAWRGPSFKKPGESRSKKVTEGIVTIPLEGKKERRRENSENFPGKHFKIQGKQEFPDSEDPWCTSFLSLKRKELRIGCRRKPKKTGSKIGQRKK